jgi:CheY-like chemotaxis protein
MDLKQLNVLLADDDIDDCIFFKNALAELHQSTNLTTVRDGEQLMDYLSENSEQLPDILFLDLNMPRKNGFECLVEIKENEKLKDLHVVMFSTSYPRDPNYEQDMINRLLKIGAFHFIRKPESFEQLKQAIEHALKLVVENNLLN